MGPSLLRHKHHKTFLFPFYYIVKVKVNLHILSETQSKNLDYSSTTTLEDVLFNIQYLQIKISDEMVDDNHFTDYMKTLENFQHRYFGINQDLDSCGPW